MNETCANGCIPSSPRVGCPVHGPKAKPPEPEDLPHPGTGRLLSASPVKPPEPAPYERWLPNEAVRELVTGLRAQLAAAQEELDKATDDGVMLMDKLAAAQARVKELEEPDNWEGHDCGRATCCHLNEERAEKAEREFSVEHSFAESAMAQLAAAIKAKEEAETEVQVRDMQLDITIKERDAERKRADNFVASAEHNARLWESAARQALAAQATAEALRAALEGLLKWCVPFNPCTDPSVERAREALAAHSKAVGP